MRKKSKKSLEEAMLYGYQFTFKDLSKDSLRFIPMKLPAIMKLFCKYPKRKEKQMSSYDEAILAAKALSSKRDLIFRL